ncbi:unnamed protein product [Closterium sp. Naga37s-1]|nr:unnamed protein product [Closterium sp. Naga37s-1]
MANDQVSQLDCLRLPNLLRIHPHPPPLSPPLSPPSSLISPRNFSLLPSYRALPPHPFLPFESSRFQFCIGVDETRRVSLGVVASVTQAFVPVRAGEVQQSLPLIGLGVAITVAAGALAVRSGLHGLVHAAVLLRLQGFSQKQHDQRQQQQEREKEQQGEGSEQNGGRINEQESLQRVKDEKRLEFSKRALRNYLDLQKREVKRSGMEGAALRLKMRMAKANGKDPLPFAPLQDKMGPRRNVMAEIRSVVAEAVAEVVEGEECTVVLERSKAQVKDVESTGEPMVVEKRVIMENDTGRGAEEAGRMIEMMEKGWYGGAVEAESGRMTGPEGDEYGLGEVGPEVFLEWSVEKAREANAHAAMRLPINTNERG